MPFHQRFERLSLHWRSIWGTHLTLHEQFLPYQTFFSWKELENWVQKNSQVGKSGRKTENTPKAVGLKIQNFSVKSVKRIARYRGRNRWAPDPSSEQIYDRRTIYGFASRNGKLRNTFHGPSNVNLNGPLFSAWREIRNLAIITYWMRISRNTVRCLIQPNSRAAIKKAL